MKKQQTFLIAFILLLSSCGMEHVNEEVLVVANSSYMITQYGNQFNEEEKQVNEAIYLG